MAVQAQHPSYSFSHDFCNRAANNVILEELQMLQDQRNLLGLYSSHLGVVNNGTVFSDPHSELTCINASGARKRPREELPMALQQPSQDPDRNLASISPRPCYPSLAAAAVPVRAADAVSASGGTSTSDPPAKSTLAQDLIAHLFHHNIEIDALVRLQSERLGSGLEEARKRHCRAVLWGVERQVARRLREKEAELEKALRRNAELEEKVRQVSAESQMWFMMAKNNGAVATSLRASLEQVLLQKAATAQAKEGYGDTDDDDALSCCFAAAEGRAAPASGELRRWRRGACRACGEREACVLLLPCKHLCLCKGCESKVHACPACASAKTACLHIFMS